MTIVLNFTSFDKIPKVCMAAVKHVLS
jgi:hypothetical protein